MCAEIWRVDEDYNSRSQHVDVMRQMGENRLIITLAKGQTQRQTFKDLQREHQSRQFPDPFQRRTPQSPPWSVSSVAQRSA